MTKITVDATTRAQLTNLDTVVQLCDESGRILGYFHPALMPYAANGLQSPIPLEESQRRRQQRTGKPLAEILDRLNRS
jgi:hypothetical protein